MSQSIDITVSGDALDAIQRLKDDAGLGRVVAREMDRQNQFTVSRIQSRYLSYPKSGPTQADGLRVISNRLRASVRASKAVPTATGVVSSIGSNVVYAAIHEFGDTIHRVTKPGSVRLKTDRQGNLRRQGRNGQLAIFARASEKHFKTVSHAGGKAYDIEMPARAPFAHGIADRADDYGAGLSSAILNYWEGKN